METKGYDAAISQRAISDRAPLNFRKQPPITLGLKSGGVRIEVSPAHSVGSHHATDWDCDSHTSAEH
jgi:hypothetical protein